MIDCPLCFKSNTRVKFRARNKKTSITESSFTCTSRDRSQPEIIKCYDCKHEFSNPNDWVSNLHEEYRNVVDVEYASLMAVKNKTFYRASNIAEKFITSGSSILEIGSYAGLFLKIMSDKGFDVVGIEPSIWGADQSRKLGLKIINSTFEETKDLKIQKKFDAVISWDVLEHVINPIEFVSQISSIIKPEGFLIISTLDRTNWFAKLTGRKWPWIIPMHLHYFDQETILNIAKNNNLSLMETKAHRHYTTAFYVLDRLFPRILGFIPHFLSNSLKLIHFYVGFGDVRYYVFKNEISKKP